MLWFFGIAWVGGAIATYHELRQKRDRSVSVPARLCEFSLALGWPLILGLGFIVGWE